MKSIRYAIYLCISLHFLRRCLRKSLTQVKHPTIDLFGKTGVNEFVSERLLKIAEDACSKKLDDSINVGYMEVTSIDTSRDKDGNAIVSADVNAMLSRPVEYVELKVSV